MNGLSIYNCAGCVRWSKWMAPCKHSCCGLSAQLYSRNNQKWKRLEINSSKLWSGSTMILRTNTASWVKENLPHTSMQSIPSAPRSAVSQSPGLCPRVTSNPVCLSIISTESNMFCQGGENYCHRLQNIPQSSRVSLIALIQMWLRWQWKWTKLSHTLNQFYTNLEFWANKCKWLIFTMIP